MTKVRQREPARRSCTREQIRFQRLARCGAASAEMHWPRIAPGCARYWRELCSPRRKKRRDPSRGPSRAPTGSQVGAITSSRKRSFPCCQSMVQTNEQQLESEQRYRPLVHLRHEGSSRARKPFATTPRTCRTAICGAWGPTSATPPEPACPRAAARLRRSSLDLATRPISARSEKCNISFVAAGSSCQLGGMGGDTAYGQYTDHLT